MVLEGSPENGPDIIDRILALWPLAASAVAGGVGWMSANMKSRAAFRAELERKIESRIDAERSRYDVVLAAAHAHEVEIATIRAVLSSATGKPFEEVTLTMVRDMVSRQTVTLQELEAFILTIPRLLWIKQRIGPNNYHMVQVSQVYADKYLGGTASIYRGKRDAEIWPEDVARVYVENDEEAYRSGSVIEIDEPVRSVLTGVQGRFQGVKWSFRLAGETYVCGVGVHAPEVVQ